MMRWGSPQADHCSGRCAGPTDRGWYENTLVSQPGKVETLSPAMDEETRRIYTRFTLV